VPESSADRPLLFPEEPFTEDDVAIAAEALWQDLRGDHPGVGPHPTPGCFHDARVMLKALAARSRLLPASAEHHEEEWGVWASSSPGIPAGVGAEVFDTEREASRYAADLLSAGWAEARVVRRTSVVGAWVEVKESTDDEH
jgi:hypothetical protein